jgi:hypothetical protein
VTNYTAPKFHYLAGAQNLDTGLSRSEPSASDTAARLTPGAAVVVLLLPITRPLGSYMAGTFFLGRGVVWVAQIRRPAGKGTRAGLASWKKVLRNVRTLAAANPEERSTIN